MDYDALCRSPLRCWGHDDCREHPELGVACGERPLEMCVSDEQRFSMEPLHRHFMPTGDGDPPYASELGGEGGVVDPSSDGLDCDNDHDDRDDGGNELGGGGFSGGRYPGGDGAGDGDKWARQLNSEADLLAEDVHRTVREFERDIERELDMLREGRRW